MELRDHANGTYRFLPGIEPYSSGVIAAPGHELVWVTTRRPLPYAEGLERAVAHLSGAGLPADALCAVALRSPQPMSLEEFAAFNRDYRGHLARLDILAEDPNPIARTNVVPDPAPPDEHALYGFAYAQPAMAGFPAPTFVVAGAAELREAALSEDAVVRPGETSEDALEEKAAHVVAVMGERLQALTVSWDAVTVVDVYTRELPGSVASAITSAWGEGSVHGLSWYPSLPPVAGLAFEMDVRGVRQELVLG